MKIKKNQVLMTEGVLPYANEDGTVSYKLKTWGNLKNFIGELAYITDEHPEEMEIGTNTKLHGNVAVHQCSNGAKALCGLVNLDENAPKKLGYSAGYSFIEKEESGTYKGQPYDKVQEITKIDHVALTDYPRNAEAIASDKMGMILSVDTDTLAKDSISSDMVNKYKFAYDSIRPFEFEESPDNIGEEIKMSENVKDIKELQKTIIDQNKVIAEFEAQQKANDAFKEEIEKQKTEKDSLIQQLNENKKALDSLKSIFEAQQKEKMQKAIDSLVKAGTKPEALEGKSWDYIQGRVD